MKKKLACITFHASYNYGSVLQAYALQEFIKQNYDVEYEILNFRSLTQKNMYKLFSKQTSIKHCLFSLVYFFPLRKKNKRFEEFINSKLQLSAEFSDEYIPETNLKNDIFIVGGDQPWNVRCKDFSWLYFLSSFTNKRKVSYSVSFGPENITFTDEEKEKIQQYISNFSNISVRESGSKNILMELGYEKDISINIDPTLLLTKEEWDKLVGERIEKKPYVLLYMLRPNKAAYELAIKLAKRTGKKIIITKPINSKDFVGKFCNRFDTGPLEFLNYIKYADWVYSTSFHGCVFSSIFNTPFVTYDGLKDNRISNLLLTCKLEDRNINNNTLIDDILKKVVCCDFSNFEKEMEYQRGKTKSYFDKIICENI